MGMLDYLNAVKTGTTASYVNNTPAPAPAPAPAPSVWTPPAAIAPAASAAAPSNPSYSAPSSPSYSTPSYNSPTPTSSSSGGSSGGSGIVTQSLPSVNATAPVTNTYNPAPVSSGTNPAYYSTATNSYVDSLPKVAPPIVPKVEPKVDPKIDPKIDESKRLYDFIINSVPKLITTTPNESKTDPEVTALVESIKAWQASKADFNPETNAGLKVSQNQATNKIRQDMVSRGRLYSGFSDSQQQQAAQGLIPEYQKQAQDEYNQKGDSLFRTLSAVQGLDNIAYNRNRDNISDINTANTNAYNQYKDTANMALDMYKTGVTERDKAATQAENKRVNNVTIDSKQVDLEAKQYGRALTPISRPQVQAYEQYMQNPAFKQKVMDNWGNLAGLINTIPNTPENAELLAALNGARVTKLMQDPQLMAQYGAEYGFGTSAKEAGELADLAGKQFDNIIKAAKASTASAEAKATLEKIQNEVEKGNIENAMSLIEGSYLEPKLKLELQNTVSAINSRTASTAQGWANVATSQKNAETSRNNSVNTINSTNSNVVSLAYKDFLDSGKDFATWVKAKGSSLSDKEMTSLSNLVNKKDQSAEISIGGN